MRNNKQIGFARVVTDYSTICYILDVVIDEAYRDMGIGTKLMKTILENDDLKDHIDDLNSNIYNLFNKQPYKLTIEHDNSRITYEQDKFGLFDSYRSITTKSSIIGE